MTELKTAEEIFNDTEFNSLCKLLTFGDKITEAMKTHTRQYIQHFAEKASWLHEKEIREIEQDILKQLK